MDVSRPEAETVDFWKVNVLQNSKRSYYLQLSQDHLLVEAKALDILPIL